MVRASLEGARTGFFALAPERRETATARRSETGRDPGPLGAERYEGDEDTNGSPGRSRPFRASGLQTPRPLEPFPPSNAIQAPLGPSVTRAGKARGLRGRPPARAGNLV